MKIEEFKKYIAPRMRRGWVAMDKSGFWYWYEKKPTLFLEQGFWDLGGAPERISDYLFLIDKPEDWKKSLFKVGAKQYHKNNREGK